MPPPPPSAHRCRNLTLAAGGDLDDARRVIQAGFIWLLDVGDANDGGEGILGMVGSSRRSPNTASINNVFTPGMRRCMFVCAGDGCV